MKKIFAFLLIFLCVGCEDRFSMPEPDSAKLGSSYVDVDGGKIFYQRFGSGNPIFVLHGGPGLDQGYLLPQMLELSKDYELIFYDQRGSGNSTDTKLDYTHINIEKFVADLDTLRSKLGFSKIILLGHSWGAKLAMHYAAAHPENVSRMILMGSAWIDKYGEQLFVSELSKRIDLKSNAIEEQPPAQISKFYKKFFSVYFYNPKDAQSLNINMKEHSAKSGVLVMKIMYRTYPSDNAFISRFHDSLRKLKIPTLIVHGKQDIIPLQIPEKIKSIIQNSKAVYLEECGHFPYIEKPKETFGEIRKFLMDKA